MNERREAGHWPARLASLAVLTRADALAVVLAVQQRSFVTYVRYGVEPAAGWETTLGGGAVPRALAERAPRTVEVEVPLTNGRVARHAIVAPLLWQQSVLGALVALREDAPFSDQDAPTAQRAAELISIELAEANALWKAQRQAQEMESRQRIREAIQRELAAADDPDALLDRITRRLAELFGADGVSLMLLDQDRAELVTRSAVGHREDVVRQARRRLGEGISGWVAQHGQPLLLKGSVQDERFSGVDPSIGGALIAPLVAQDKILGVVNVKARGATEKYGQADVADLASVAQDIGVAIERAAEIRQIEEDRRQALVLFELSRLGTLGGDPQGDLETAVVMIGDALRHDVVGVWIHEGGGDLTLRLRAHRGYGEVLPSDVPVEGDAALQGAFVERRVQRVDGAGAGRWAIPRASFYVLAPIGSGAQALGVLIAGRAGGAYSTSEAEFTVALADYLAGLVQKTAVTDVLQQTATSERRRIAQELHDGLAQELTGVVLALEGCQRALERDPDVLPTQLAKAARDARACLADIRQYMTALRQQDASALTLPVTVSRLVDDLRRASGLVVELEEIGAERPLPPQVERSIVRIAQEALHNIAQHAAAARAKVILHYDEEEVMLTIEDDGAGFPLEQTVQTAEQRGRFGLLGMKERAEGVGGRLLVRSEPGRGTIVQARIPYDASRGLTVVPTWPSSRLGTEAQPEATPAAPATDDEGEPRGGFLGRLFGR